MMFFVKIEDLGRYPLLARELIDETGACLDVVHPDYYLEVMNRR
jgi:hypothetical protein